MRNLKEKTITKLSKVILSRNFNYVFKKLVAIVFVNLTSVSMMSLNAFAGFTDPSGVLSTIEGILGPGVTVMGGVVAAIGGIQLAVAFTQEDAVGKTRGIQTIIAGAIVAAVGGAISFTV